MDAGQCAGVTTTPVGTGMFVWPTNVRQVSGNPYAPWHRGVDLSGSPSDPVYAADTGVVTHGKQVKADTTIKKLRGTESALAKLMRECLGGTL